MKTAVNLLKELNQKIENRIAKKINSIGVKSEHNSKPCIQIKDENIQFNLDGGRYLTEVTKDTLIDNRGYEYDFFVLEMNDFVKVADYISKQKK